MPILAVHLGAGNFSGHFLGRWAVRMAPSRFGPRHWFQSAVGSEATEATRRDERIMMGFTGSPDWLEVKSRARVRVRLRARSITVWPSSQGPPDVSPLPTHNQPPQKSAH